MFMMKHATHEDAVLYILYKAYCLIYVSFRFLGLVAKIGNYNNCC